MPAQTPADMTRLPAVRVGAGALSGLPGLLRGDVGPRCVLVVADAYWPGTDTFARMRAALGRDGWQVVHYAGFGGEPTAADIRAATRLARESGATQVVGLGGGTALDSAKLIAACAVTGADPGAYALGRGDMPAAPLPKILVPTTAGTGSEANGNCIFTGDTGKKLWAFSADNKADRVILDPDLTASLPPAVAAWSGMDALVHAFEAATNRHANRLCQPFALHALGLICGALERAVTCPADSQARADMLLGSFYAGYAIENCGTALAHCVSHALAGCAGVNHAQATALAFERTLPRVLAAATPEMDAAARACGAGRLADLGPRVGAMMDRLGIERALPGAFARVRAADLAAEMQAEENAPMRHACVPGLDASAINDVAADILTLAPETEPLP